jgi:hypothetical protein
MEGGRRVTGRLRIEEGTPGWGLYSANGRRSIAEDEDAGAPAMAPRSGRSRASRARPPVRGRVPESR